jgi:hypothetical protein
MRVPPADHLPQPRNAREAVRRCAPDRAMAYREPRRNRMRSVGQRMHSIFIVFARSRPASNACLSDDHAVHNLMPFEQRSCRSTIWAFSTSTAANANNPLIIRGYSAISGGALSNIAATPDFYRSNLRNTSCSSLGRRAGGWQQQCAGD